MSEWLNEVFSGGVSLSRVNPFGIVMMILAVVLIAAARPVAERMRKASVQTIKIAGLFLCAAGAAIAIL